MAPIILVGFGFTQLQAYLFNIAVGGVHGVFILSASYVCTRYRNTRCYVLFVICLIR
jgi:hypothetical protein